MNHCVERHLVSPDYKSKITHGTLYYDHGYYFLKGLAPAVREVAKRLFPGCVWGRGKRDEILRFKDSKRTIENLNWFMLHFPMDIENIERYEISRQQAIEFSKIKKSNTELKSTYPNFGFNGQLFEFQAKGVSYLIHNQRTILGDDMGLGKTVEALAAISQIGKYPVLVVCPPNLIKQWDKMANRFLGNGSGSIVEVMKGLTPHHLNDKPVYLIHYGLLRGWKDVLMEIRFPILIYDEIQELRHTGTQKYSVASLISENSEYVWGLSGTPIHNYGGEIWSVTNIVDYHCMGDWESFSREWCDGYGSSYVSKPDVLCDYLKSEGLLLRRKKDDVLSELPPKRRVVQYIDHDQDVYNTLIKDAVRIALKYDELITWSDKGKAALEMETFSRQATGLSKAPFVGDFVLSLLHAGEHPLIYSWHHSVHDAIEEKLQRDKTHKWKVGRITGKESMQYKNETVQAFAEGKIDAVILSLRATAGLDGLQGAGTCIVFAELDWSPAIHSQCEDRLHRLGIKEMESLLCYYLVSQTGYDGIVMDALGLKIGQFVGIMGDKAETEDDKIMAQKAAQKHLRQMIDRLKGDI